MHASSHEQLARTRSACGGALGLAVDGAGPAAASCSIAVAGAAVGPEAPLGARHLLAVAGPFLLAQHRRHLHAAVRVPASAGAAVPRAPPAASSSSAAAEAELSGRDADAWSVARPAVEAASVARRAAESRDGAVAVVVGIGIVVSARGGSLRREQVGGDVASSRSRSRAAEATEAVPAAKRIARRSGARARWWW